MEYLLDLGSTLSEVGNTIQNLLEYDLDQFTNDTVHFLDFFISKTFFLSEEQSAELEKILFQIAEFVTELIENQQKDVTKEMAFDVEKGSTYLDPYEISSNLPKYLSVGRNVSTFPILIKVTDIIMDSDKWEVDSDILTRLRDIQIVLYNFYTAALDYVSTIQPFLFDTSEYKKRDLAFILQCWRGIDDVYQDPRCLNSHSEQLIQFVTYLKSVEETYELISTTINSTYLSRDFTYNRICVQHLVAKPMLDILNTENGNKSEVLLRMKHELVSRGNLTDATADSLLQSQLDVNRLSFYNFVIPKQVSMLGMRQ